MTKPSNIFKKLTLEFNVGFTGAAGNKPEQQCWCSWQNNFQCASHISLAALCKQARQLPELCAIQCNKAIYATLGWFHATSAADCSS